MIDAQNDDPTEDVVKQDSLLQDSLLQDLLDGRLGESEAARVRARIQAEEPLREAWEELLQLGKSLRAEVGPRAPHDFLTQVKRRIEVGASAGSGPTPSSAGAESEGRARWGIVALAAAALLVAGIGVKLAAPTTSAVSSVTPESLERAAVPADKAALEESLEDALDHAPDDAEGEPAFVRSRARRERSAGQPRGFRPGDQVPPGIREPTDAGSPPQVSPPESGPSGEPLAASSEKMADAPVVLALAAPDADEGRAHLAILVSAALGDEPGAIWSGPKISERRNGAPSEVIGEVFLTLAPDVASRLCQLAANAPNAPDAPDAPGASGAPETPETTRLPAGPAQPAAQVEVKVVLLRAE